MQRFASLLIGSVGLLSAGFICMEQKMEPVKWQFEGSALQGNEMDLSITATILPGWHLYSQNIKEGGPIPTRIIFEPSDDYLLSGITEEDGVATRYYDHTYAMEITSYSAYVVFMQRIILNNPVTRIRGKVEYMCCNDDVCIPFEREFHVDVKP